MTKATLSRIIALALLTAAVSVCEAKPPFLKAFMSTYKLKEDSAIGKARCLNCHQPPGPPRRNPYGMAVQAEMSKQHSRMVTTDILRAIEKQNDGDGVAFITKINKGISPANPMPKPPVKAKPAKSKSKPKKHALFFPGAGSTGTLILCLIPSAFVFARKRNQPS